MKDFYVNFYVPNQGIFSLLIGDAQDKDQAKERTHQYLKHYRPDFQTYNILEVYECDVPQYSKLNNDSLNDKTEIRIGDCAMGKKERDAQRRWAFNNSPEKIEKAKESINRRKEKYSSLVEKNQKERKQYKEGLAFFHENRKNIIFLREKVAFAILKIENTYRIAQTTLHPKDTFCEKKQKSILGQRLMDPKQHTVFTVTNPHIFENFLDNYMMF